jgi:hypothetical protein
MFDGKFQTLDNVAMEMFFKDVEADIAPVKFTKGKTVVQYTSLSFYNEYKLYAVSDYSLPSPNTRYFLYRPRDVNMMNWTNTPIYRVNERAPIKLDRITCIHYARFFYHFVRGQLGQFIIVEKPEDIIIWLPNATHREKIKVNRFLTPISYNGIGSDKCINLTAIVIFKNALFKMDVKIAPFEMDVLDPKTKKLEFFTIGQMEIINQKLLLTNLNIQVSQPPGEFG